MVLAHRRGMGTSTNVRTHGLPFWTTFWVCAVLAVFLLWKDHRAHALGLLPYALLLICPVVHLFMHRGHRRHAPLPGEKP